MPPNEIWIDFAYEAEELFYWFCHELIEAVLMKDFNRLYADAHDCATECEDWLRTLSSQKDKRG